MRPLYSLVFLFFLCLLLTAGRDLAAQDSPDKLQKLANIQYQLTTLKMSDDGRWLTAWKSYDLNQDTLLIFDSRHPGKPVGFRTKVTSMAFTCTGQLLITHPNQAELIDPDKQTATCYPGVKKAQALENKGRFVLHYNAEGQNRLELRDNNGELVNEASQVSRFYATEKDHIYAITENEKKECEVFFLSDKEKEKVYSSARKILFLDIDPGEQGIMIYEQSPGSSYREALYLDLKTKATYPLKEVLPVDFQRGFSEMIREGGIYFLRLWIKKEKEDTSQVDIWYGDDNRLEEKFFSPIQEVYYAWKPREKQVRQIGTDQITKNANIGSERYFLSFDPYLLQDYTKPAPLKINFYDQLDDHYFPMDTIQSELHVSPDGQYVLYFKNSNWYMYQIATMTRKVVGSNELKAPCFAHNGKMILFEGDSGLWQYDSGKSSLTKLDDFKGYKVTILNSASTKDFFGIDFCQKTVEIEKPLVIKLFDPLVNKSAYILWQKEKEKYRTIIPLTSKYIQSLVYDIGYKHFSYIEEDYNMPPRLVYKQMSKEQTLGYQSNQQDKAILSLRQEIIPYTNSDSIRLKGILYYPLNYNPSSKYPMVVHIYEKQNQLANRYPYQSYYEGVGFNIRLFLDKGYFVYLPDIVIQGKAGPGLDALDCVNKALDALTGNPLIDKQRIGLIGHSFGGYETDFIATRSSRFAAYVSGAGHSDIIWAYHAFNYNFLNPDYIRLESNIYNMRVPFSGNSALYFENNPIYNAEKVNAPVLLWAGLEDKNVTSDHSMAFYNALRRNNKDVIALFYKEEGHSLQHQQAQFDLTSKVLDWFDYFLNNDTGIEWIDKGIKKKDAP